MSSLYLECNAGISGDMAVAALLDAGADKGVLQKALDSIPAKGFKTEISRVSKNGIDCSDFNVILDSEHENHDHDMDYLFGHESHSECNEESVNGRHSEQREESVGHRHSEGLPEESTKRCFADAQHDEFRHSEQSEESLNFPFTEKQDVTNAKGFIYIVTNKTKTTLYIGVTSDLKKRIYEHKSHAKEGFTAKYNCENLVYFECFADMKSAIEREKYLKGKNRDYKENLIDSINPSWQDLYDYLFRDVSATPQHDVFRHSEQQVCHSERSEESANHRHSECNEESAKRCFAVAQHDGNHHEHHHHEHRNLNDVLEIIGKTQMTDGARSLARKVFQIIAEAESKAHGLPLEQVHFHEVGAIDSIVDVIALSVCFDNLNPGKVYVPFMNEGTGTVRCQHGILPIPVPAVASIAQEYSLPLHLISDKGEFITPTGAAFVAAVMTDKVLPESFEIKRIGLGAGKRAYSRPSILRAFIIEENVNKAAVELVARLRTKRSEVTTKTGHSDRLNDHDTSDEIVKLETNIDDCTGQALGFVMDELLAAGARDVHYIPCFMKKNRPAYLLNVICTESDREKMESIIFKHTTTIGIRRSVMKRTVLDRRELELDSPYGKFRAKVVAGSGIRRSAPEYDDAVRIARETGKPFGEIYSELSDLCRKY